MGILEEMTLDDPSSEETNFQVLREDVSQAACDDLSEIVSVNDDTQDGRLSLDWDESEPVMESDYEFVMRVLDEKKLHSEKRLVEKYWGGGLSPIYIPSSLLGPIPHIPSHLLSRSAHILDRHFFHVNVGRFR
jgi:hypothetical protein